MMKRLFAGRFTCLDRLSFKCTSRSIAVLLRIPCRAFIATDYDFPKEISEDYALQKHGVPARPLVRQRHRCYILLLPLAVFWIAGWFGYTARWLYRSSAFFFIFFYSLCFIISAANIPYFAYFFKPINSSIFNWFGYMDTTAGMVFGGIVLLLPHRLGPDSHRGFCLHHPPAVAHVLPF